MANEIRFDRQVAVVTGAGRSIGRTYAIELARRGAAVVVNDIGGLADAEGAWADAVVAEIAAAGGRAVACTESVASGEGGEAIIDTALRHFGTVDVVIHNAGFLRTAMFDTMTPRQLLEIIGVHLLGAFHVAQPAWRVMRAKRYGRVVLTSSSAILGMQGNSNYAAAKAGLIGLARSLACEGEPLGIRANCVLPFAVSNIRDGNAHVGGDATRNAELQGAMTSRRTTESVFPLTLYLASRHCAVNGEAYSALAGRYARLFLGLTEGWLSRDANAVKVEDIAGHLDQINDLERFIAPRTMIGELEEVLARLQRIDAEPAA